MIKNNEALSMAEAIEYVKKIEDSEANIKGFIKKFTKLTNNLFFFYKFRINPLIGIDLISLFFDLVIVIRPLKRSTSSHFKFLASLYLHPVLNNRTTKV